jgi:hypothetical protein
MSFRIREDSQSMLSRIWASADSDEMLPLHLLPTRSFRDTTEIRLELYRPGIDSEVSD